jgi:hypothetical protein
VVGALVLAGCSSIPSSGPVVQGPRVDVIRNDGYVRVIARPPSSGMTPEALVRGFLSACASVADGDDTARKYLTSAASATWNSDTRIDVYDAGSLTVTLERNDTVRITAPLIGTIDSRHRYHVAEPGAMMTDDLHVTQVNGEWRIDALPHTLFLDQMDVARGFRAHPVYLLNPARTRLVPEYVMLPLSTTNVLAPLARAAVAGLADGSVATSKVSVTQSLFGFIIGDFGAAIVGLDRRVMRMSAADRDAVIAQLTWTLTALPSVSSVSVQVDGRTLASRTGLTSHTRSEFASFDPTRELAQHMLLYVQDDQILSLIDGVPRILSRGRAAAEATVSPDGRMLVAVTASRKLLDISVSGKLSALVASGSDLAAPAVLTTGETWFVDREAKGRLLMWDSATPVRPVDTGLPDRARILDFAIAPDEVRIALIINNGATTTVRVGRIVRDAKGVRIVGLVRVEQRLTSAVAVAWAGESELGVLGAVGAVAVQPISVSLPLGTVSLIGGPANAVSLAAVPGAPMVVGDQTGQLWEYLDGRWGASELGSAPSYAH